jgi:hypothetical protein
MMDGERPRTATRMAAGLAEPAVSFPDPLAPAAEETAIEPMAGVAAPAEPARQQIPFPTDAAPEMMLPLARRRELWQLLYGRHPLNPPLSPS